MDNNYNNLIHLRSLSADSANKLTNIIEKAWEVFISENPAYGSPEIKENSILFSIPRDSSKRREDVYKLSIFFKSGCHLALDSWSNITAFLEAGKAKITVDDGTFSIEPEEN